MVFDGVDGSFGGVEVVDIWGDKLVGEVIILEHDTSKIILD